MPNMNELEDKLRSEIDAVYFQPEEKFKPLMYVMEVLAAEIKPFDESTSDTPISPEPISTRRKNAIEEVSASPDPDKSKKRNSTISGTVAAADEPIYISVRTLAGKVLPVPSVGPADSVCDVYRSLETTYGVKCGEGKGSAGLYYQGVALLDPLLPLRELPLPAKGATLIIQNHAYETLQRQMHCVDNVVEGFLGAHYNTLSSSVHAIGDVSRQFYGLKERVATLRRQVGDTKQLLTVGMREQPIRELWERKREYTYMLSMMDTLKTIRDAPAVIDSLLERRCYVSAVSQFNTAKDLMFAEEMVPIPALEGVRDQIHGRKSRLLDIIAESVQDLLFSLPKDEFQSLTSDAPGRRRRPMTSPDNEEEGDRLVAILGRDYSVGQVMSLEATLNDHVKPTNGEGGVDLNHGSSGTIRSDDVALRLQLLLEASHTMQSLGDIQSYVMERTKEGLYRLDRTVRLFVQAKLKIQNPGLYGASSGRFMNEDLDEFNNDSSRTAPLVMFLEHLFHCYLTIINRHLKLCELVHITKSGHQGGGGGINWLPAEHLWAEIQEHLRELLTNFFSDSILGESSEQPISPTSPNSPGDKTSSPQVPAKMLRRNGSKAYFSFRGADLTKAGRRGNVRLLGDMAGLHSASFTVVSANAKAPPEESPSALLAKIAETPNTSDPLASFPVNEDEEFSLCEPDPMHACAVALFLHQFVDSARTSMAHFLPLVDPDSALGAAEDFLSDPSAPSPEIDYWLRAVVSESVLPLLREDASEALDAVLTDRDAFKPSQTFAAATAAAAAAEATAAMRSHVKSSDKGGNRSRNLGQSMRGGSVAAAAGATAATAAAEASIAKAVAHATGSMPPPVCCIEGADAVLGSLISQVGSLPFHAAPLCDLVEDIAITLVARLKEEGMRLFGSSEAAERISRGGGSLEEMMRKESCLESFKLHYLTVHQPLSDHSTTADNSRGSIFNSAPADWNNPAMSDLWNLGQKPYLLTNDSLITDRRVLGSLSALAHSAQWLSQRMAKRTAQLLGGGTGGSATSVTDSRSRRRGGRESAGSGGVPCLTGSSPLYRRLQAANKHFSTYAESLLLVLRMDAVLSTFLFLQQLPESYAKFMRASSAQLAPHGESQASSTMNGKGRDEDGTGAMALIRGGGAKHTPVHIHLGPSRNTIVDSCVAALEKHLSLLQRSMLSTAPPAAWAVVVNPISRLAPQIAMKCLAHFPRPHIDNRSFLLAPGASIYDQALPFSERGIDHLLRGVTGALRQVLIGVGANQKALTDSAWDAEISRAEHYITLLEKDGVGFDNELRKKPPVFTRDEFLVIWRLSGPLRKAGAEEDFNVEWESAHGQ